MLEIRIVEDFVDFGRLVLEGDLDSLGVSQVEVTFLAHSVAKQRNTVVDLSKVPFISSLGISMLLNVNKALQRLGKKLVLLQPQSFVVSTLSLTRLRTTFLITDEEEEVQKFLGK